VRVWRCDLDRAVSRPEWLDEAERSRAAALRFDDLRRRYVAAHTFLRAALAEWVGVAPLDLVFARGAFGKPHLVLGQAPDFSFSHSEGTAYLAVDPAGPIGVDVELARPIRDPLGSARLVFSASEQATLRELRVPARDEAFLVTWTRKESWVKAVGVGLAGGDLRGTHVGAAREPVEIEGLFVQSLPPSDGEIVAITSKTRFRAPVDIEDGTVLGARGS
jgi:4'-phosphopantetheinyl transferase